MITEKSLIEGFSYTICLKDIFSNDSFSETYIYKEFSRYSLEEAGRRISIIIRDNLFGKEYFVSSDEGIIDITIPGVQFKNRFFSDSEYLKRSIISWMNTGNFNQQEI